MRLLGHLMAADLRRFRWMVLGWLALVVAAGVIEWIGPGLALEARRAARLSALTGLAWLALLLVNVFLVPLVVQADPVVGTEAFWMTRPIPPRLLLLSKIVFLGLLTVAAPVLVETILMAAARMPAADIGRTAIEMTLFRAMWLAVWMVPAALTSNLARFAALCGAVLIGFVLVIAAAEFVHVDVHFDAPPHALAERLPIDPTYEVMATIALGLGALALVGTQYRTRRRLYSVPLFVAGAVAAWLAASYWPWPFLQRRLDMPAWASAQSALRLTVDPSTVAFDDGPTWSAFIASSWRYGRGRIEADGVEPRWAAHVTMLDATLTLPSGSALISGGDQTGGALLRGASRETAEQAAVRAALGVERLWARPESQNGRAVVFVIRDDDFKRLTPQTARFHGDFRLDPMIVAVAGAVPLTPGARLQQGNYRFVLDRATPEAQGISLQAREWSAKSGIDRRAPASFSWYLRNTRRSEAVEGGASGGGDFALLSALFASDTTDRFRIRSVRLTYPPPGSGDQLWALDEAWLKDAELVIVRETEARSVRRTLDISDFPIRAATPSESR